MKTLILKILTNSISHSVEKNNKNIHKTQIYQLSLWIYKLKASLKNIKETSNKECKIEF
jgi:hypothetical protein